MDAPYGGSLDNRLRLTFDVLAAIRKRVGSRFIVGVRYTADEVIAGGLTRRTALTFRDVSKKAEWSTSSILSADTLIQTRALPM